MSRIVTHRGEFLSRAGVRYRADIWKEDGRPEDPFAKPAQVAPQELRFEADEALVIEWAEAAKEDPVCASTATLRIESPGDRTYIGLYTVKAAEVGLDVYRNGALYWRGTIDPESYEEPYDKAAYYPVSLTFSDFGVLDRVKFAPPSDVVSLQRLILSCSKAAGLHPLSVDDSRTALTDAKGNKVIGALSCKAANFFDEDGTAQTLRGALETMLQPCGLKLMQRGGKLWLFDMQGLYNAPHREVVWSSDSQQMGVDKIANNIRLTFSPYAQSKILDGDTLKFNRRFNMADVMPGGKGVERAWVFYTNKTAATAKLGTQRRRRLLDTWNAEALRQEAEFIYAEDNGIFRIIPLRGGDASVGVVCRACQTVREPGEAKPTWSNWHNYEYRRRSTRVYIPPIGDTVSMVVDQLSAAPDRPFLRLTMDCLMDMRYNPFAEIPNARDVSDDDNDRAAYNNARVGAAWCFAPVRIALYRRKDDRDAAYTYSNEDTAFTASDNPLRVNGSERWKTGGAGRSWLAYYPDPDQIRENSALLKGWATNRPNIGRPDGTELVHVVGQGDIQTDEWAYDGGKGREVFKWLQKLTGEFIPYPPEGGWLEISYGAPLVIHDYKARKHGDASASFGREEFFRDTYFSSRGLNDKIQWLLYKAPEVEVVRGWGDFAAVEVPDVELRATLHPDANEELKFDLKCGTLPGEDAEGESVSRGVYVDVIGQPLRQLKRAEQTDAPERLFVNSLYSQYAAPCVKLSGEAYIDPDGLAAYRERSQPIEARFIATAVRQDLITDCGDVTLVRIGVERYVPAGNYINE